MERTLTHYQRAVRVSQRCSVPAPRRCAKSRGRAGGGSDSVGGRKRSVGSVGSESEAVASSSDSDGSEASIMPPQKKDSLGNDWVSCDLCNDWILYENSGMKTPFNELKKTNEKLTCRACLAEKRIVILEQLMARLETTAETTKQSIDSGTRQWAAVVKESNEVKEKVNNAVAALATSKRSGDDLTPPQLHQVTEEMADAKRRELNLIIAGLQERGNDISDLIEYAKHCHTRLTGDDIQAAERLGRPGPNPRLLRIKLMTTAKRRNLLMMRLNDPDQASTSSHGIYIRPDLTRAQMELDKQLRAELASIGKDKFMIRNGKIIPRSVQGNTQSLEMRAGEVEGGTGNLEGQPGKGKSVISQCYHSKPKASRVDTSVVAATKGAAVKVVEPAPGAADRAAARAAGASLGDAGRSDGATAEATAGADGGTVGAMDGAAAGASGISETVAGAEAGTAAGLIIGRTFHSRVKTSKSSARDPPSPPVKSSTVTTARPQDVSPRDPTTQSSFSSMSLDSFDIPSGPPTSSIDAAPRPAAPDAPDTPGPGVPDASISLANPTPPPITSPPSVVPLPSPYPSVCDQTTLAPAPAVPPFPVPASTLASVHIPSSASSDSVTGPSPLIHPTDRTRASPLTSALDQSHATAPPLVGRSTLPSPPVAPPLVPPIPAAINSQTSLATAAPGNRSKVTGFASFKQSASSPAVPPTKKSYSPASTQKGATPTGQAKSPRSSKPGTSSYSTRGSSRTSSKKIEKP